MKLDGKAALITGGSSGIGLATARLFREEGARVVIAGRDHDRLERARRDLGKGTTAVRADLRKLEDVERLVEAARSACGVIDILFANAGSGIAAMLESVTEEQIDDQLALNVKGIFFVVQKSVPFMPRGSSIVLTSSFLSTIGASGLSILSASKAAVRSLARSMAAELAARGIRVNAVSPGPVSTPFLAKLGLSDVSLDAAASIVEARVPLHRFGEPDEIARAVLFLASADASYVTGAELVVDGGTTQI